MIKKGLHFCSSWFLWALQGGNGKCSRAHLVRRVWRKKNKGTFYVVVLDVFTTVLLPSSEVAPMTTTPVEWTWKCGLPFRFPNNQRHASNHQQQPACIQSSIAPSNMRKYSVMASMSGSAVIWLGSREHGKCVATLLPFVLRSQKRGSTWLWVHKRKYWDSSSPHRKEKDQGKWLHRHGTICQKFALLRPADVFYCARKMLNGDSCVVERPGKCHFEHVSTQGGAQGWRYKPLL